MQQTQFIVHLILEDNAAKIAERNSSTYVLRKSETRALNDRIYRLRYVIPKDYTGQVQQKNQRRIMYYKNLRQLWKKIQLLK